MTDRGPKCFSEKKIPFLNLGFTISSVSNVYFSFFLITIIIFSAVLSVAQEAVLSDRQDLSDSDQTGFLAPKRQRDTSHAHLQESRTRHRGGQTVS